MQSEYIKCIYLIKKNPVSITQGFQKRAISPTEDKPFGINFRQIGAKQVSNVLSIKKKKTLSITYRSQYTAFEHNLTFTAQ